MADLLVVNANTGEIVKELKPGDRLVSGRSIESYVKLNNGLNTSKNYHKQVMIFDVDEFQKINSKELRALLSELNSNEKAFLFSILPYVDYESCGIVHNGFTEFIIDDLAILVKMSRPTVRVCINSLIDKMLIARCFTGNKRNKYIINPWLCTKGRYINATLKHLFSEYPVRCKGGVLWKEL